MTTKLRTLWQENRSFVLFIVLMSLFRSALADWNDVPTGSMKPTILEGDRVNVNKLAYDLRIPFTHISLCRLGEPQRGDIAVFDSKASGKRLIKRVVGLPGDTIAMVNNQLFINGKAIQYEKTGVDGDLLEHLPGVTHVVHISNARNHAFANFPSVRVPTDQYLMLGDNRDVSADSRVIGFVPRNEIIGRSSKVVMSLNYDNFYLPRVDRFFKSL